MSTSLAVAGGRDAEVLFEAARGRVATLTLPAPVVALRLAANHLPPFAPEGRDLFDDRPLGALPFAQLRERLRARLGEEAVTQICTTSDPRPERSQIPTSGRMGSTDCH